MPVTNSLPFLNNPSKQIDFPAVHYCNVTQKPCDNVCEMLLGYFYAILAVYLSLFLVIVVVKRLLRSLISHNYVNNWQWWRKNSLQWIAYQSDGFYRSIIAGWFSFNQTQFATWFDWWIYQKVKNRIFESKINWTDIFNCCIDFNYRFLRSNVIFVWTYSVKELPGTTSNNLGMCKRDSSHR